MYEGLLDIIGMLIMSFCSAFISKVKLQIASLEKWYTYTTFLSDNEALVAMVRNAGAVFCGRYAPASLGDYVAGPSHVLPTNGTARFASALTVHDFMKDVHIVFVEQEGLEAMGDAVEALAGAEGLDAHAASIRLRRGAER